MNEQRAFDTILAHLREQGKPSVVPREGDDFVDCRYRHGGLKCAVGVLIPDADYRSRLEGLPVVALMDILEPWARKVNQWLLEDMQRAHDTAATETDGGFFASLERQSAIIARTHKLTYTPPEGQS